MKKVPHIVAGPPGPKAEEWIRRDESAISQSVTRVYPLVVERGEGMVIEDVDGNRYLDFTSGIAVASTGHCHPAVVEAAVRQVQTLIHMSGTDFYYRPEVLLAEKLTAITPGDFAKKVFFTNSGTEASEAAMKLARYHTRRPLFLAFTGGFHGRTMGALSLTASKAVHRKGFSPLVPGVTHVPYAYCYRCAYGLKPESCNLYCVAWIEEELFRTQVPPEEVAALFVEPIQGEGGYVVPPPGFLPRLRELTAKYGILLVVDEIQTGMGRTGRMFACDHEGVVPEILMIAKGIA
ncbi:MAG: aminotransferase class III-fold pyridoxal phosphate-dependent enzyme, partial [Nitrospirae bacterium]|nr:aminotransferase class III-fold pyridoxal phosphate-dependent enzyme [Nitrospirota bacterium]